MVLLRELRGRGYTGGYSILKEYVHPFRRPHLPQATRRFETEPGEQAQVDWGSFTYFTSEGKKKQVWAFVMVLSWSRAIYVDWYPKPTWPPSSGATSTPLLTWEGYPAAASTTLPRWWCWVGRRTADPGGTPGSWTLP